MKSFFCKITIAAILFLGTACTLFSQSGYELSFLKANSQYVTVPNSLSFQTVAATFTMEAFVNVNGGTNNTILDKGDYNFLWQLNANGNGNKMGFYNKATGTWVYSTADVNQYIPQHVAITLNGTLLTFYINGVASGTATVSNYSLDTEPLNIGRQQPIAGGCQCNHFNGTMDEVRIWNVVRTQAQIQANMNVGIDPNSAGLVAYYKFDEGTGTTTADATTHGNNGTLVNGPTWVVSSLQYYNNGVYTYTVPPGVQSIRLKMWGGGAAGSGCLGYSGGGGAFLQSKSLLVTAGQIYTIVTGSGGTSANAAGGESYIMLNGTKIVGASGGAYRYGQGGVSGAANIEYSYKGGDAGSNIEYVDNGGFTHHLYGGGGASGGTNGPGGNGQNATTSDAGTGGQPVGTGGAGAMGGHDVNCSQTINAGGLGVNPGGGGTTPFVNYQQGGGGHGKVIISQCYDPGSIVGHTMPFPYELPVDSVYDATPGGFSASCLWQQSSNNSTWTNTTVTSRSYPIQVANPPNEMYYRRTAIGCGFSSNAVVVRTFSQANGKLNGTIPGRVTSANGAGVSGITITVKKIAALPGSPVTKTYTTITDGAGNYQIPNIFYGDVSNGDSTNVSFTVTPSKQNHNFTPAFSTASLSNTNATSLAQNFTDTTVYAISGTVTQTCVGCIAGFTTDTRDSVKVVAAKTPGTVPTALSFTGDYGPGKFGVILGDPGSYKMTPSEYKHTFTPTDSTVTIVNDDVPNVNFKDNSTHTISGIFTAGCGENIGTVNLEFTDTVKNSAGPKFKMLVTTAANGTYSVTLPSRKYKIRVLGYTPNTAGSDIPVNDLLVFFNNTIKDSLITNIDTINRVVNLVYHRPPVLQMVNFNDTTCGAYVALRQNRPRTFIVNIYEGDPSHNCKVKTDSNQLKLVTSVQGEDVNDTLVYYQKNGADTITLIPGSPNIIPPYQKFFNLTYKDLYNRAATPIFRNVVVLGVKADPGTFTTVSPQIPLMILHDPPGDNSSSFWQTNKSTTTAMRFFAAETGSVKTWAQVKVGVDLILGFGVSTENKFWGQINAALGVSAKVNEASEAIVTTTTSQLYSTADNSTITGQGGDVYIGAALNLLYSIARVVDYTSPCTLGVEKKLMIADSGFNTKYAFSENHIVNTLIPSLQNIASLSTGPAKDRYLNQISVWQQVLANNAKNKARAAFDQNISFDGTTGPQTSYTTTSSSQSSSLEFNVEIEHTVAVELGLEIAGNGFSGGVNVGLKLETGKSTTTTITDETTTGYTIDDHSDGDYFTVDVKKDPVYNTPVFVLVAGAASCPAEPVAQQRDKGQLLIPNPVQSGIAANGTAQFQLKLSNVSESNENRTYNLSFVQASNPNGAIVNIGGSPAVVPIPYPVNYGDSGVTVTVTVKRDTSSPVFSFEGLQFQLTDDCDQGGKVLATNTISAYFVSPCSNITLAAPANNWVINSSNNNSIPVQFTGYTLSSLQSVALQHSVIGSNSWVTDTTIFQALITNPTSTTVNWNVAGIADGAYELRFKLVCGTGTVYSSRVSGIIDRIAPTVLGIPEPTDANYVTGDVISFSFNENLNTSGQTTTQAELRRLNTNTVIPVQVSGYQNKLVIMPVTSIASFTGDSMRVILKNVTDVYGNVKPTPDTLFFVVGNSVAGSGSNAVTMSAIKLSMRENANDSMDIRFTIATPNQFDRRQINFTVSGSAAFGQDYTVRYPAGQPLYSSFDGTQGSITILPNTTTAILRIKPIGDALLEGDETITVSLAEGGDYVLGSVISITDTIKNDDHTAPVIIPGGPTSICNGSTLSLTVKDSIDGQPVYAYLWSNGSSNRTINVSTAGSYTVTVYTLDGLTGVSAPLQVSYLASPSLGADKTVYKNCYGETTNLTTLYTTTGLTTSWNTATPTSVPPGTYRLIATNTAGCKDTAFANIILEVATWKGTISTDWNNAANWNTGIVPSSRTHVIIPSGTPNICTVSATTNASMATLQVRTGAKMNVDKNGQTNLGSVKCATLPPN